MDERTGAFNGWSIRPVQQSANPLLRRHSPAQHYSCHRTRLRWDSFRSLGHARHPYAENVRPWFFSALHAAAAVASSLMTSWLQTFCIGCATLALLVGLQGQSSAQGGVTVSGRLVNSVSGEPIGSATVQIDELRRQTVSAADGSFAFESVPPGTYHLSVRSPGYSSRRSEVTVANDRGGCW
jgi:hypothetical protein